MSRILEIPVEPGDRKIIVLLDEKQPDKARIEIHREDAAPLKTIETLRKAAA